MERFDAGAVSRGGHRGWSRQHPNPPGFHHGRRGTDQADHRATGLPLCHIPARALVVLQAMTTVDTC